MKPPDAGTTLSRLPPEARLHTEQLVRALRDTLGDALAAVVVHGSLVRGGYDANRSDVDVLVILERDDRALLEKIGPALETAAAAASIDCVLFLRRELAHAADVFPLLFDDVRRCHAVLYAKGGVDPLQDMVVLDTHRLLRIEQELRDLRVRLRRLTAVHVDRRSALAERLREKLKQLRSPLAGLLHARGQPPANDSLGAVLEAAAVVYGLKLGALSRIDVDVPAAADATAALLDAAIADVDARGKAHLAGGASS